MEFKMIHNNFNVLNLDKSLKFYEAALGLTEQRRKEAEDGSFCCGSFAGKLNASEAAAGDFGRREK